MNRRTMLAGIIAAPLATIANPAEAKPRKKKRWAKPDPRERMRQKYFPDVELETHEGKTVRFYSDLVKDKIVVFNFMYATCNGTCVPTTANLRKVHKLLEPRMGKDVFFYSLTLQPETDSVEVLKKFAANQKIGAGWSLLTGKPTDLERLRRSLGFSDPDPQRDAVRTNHAAMLRYGNEPKMYWAGCPALIRPEAIAQSIRWLG